MKCYYHNNTDAVPQCVDCGKSLCRNCAEKYEPILCPECFSSRISNCKSTVIKNIVLSVVLFVAGIILYIVFNDGKFGAEAFATAYCMASLPWGWRALNKITPDIFLFMPIVGWIIYFAIKAFLSVIIGWIAMPIKMIKSVVELNKLNKLQ